MPGFPAVLAYLAGVGLVVPLAGILLDRVALPASVTGLHKAAWLIAGLLWLVQSLAAPSPLRLSVPLLIWVTVWAMKRQPAGLTRPPVLPPAPLWRHGLFLLTPVLASVLAVRGWALIGGMEIWAFALVLSATGLGLWFWLIGAAVWRSLRPAVPSG